MKKKKTDTEELVEELVETKIKAKEEKENKGIKNQKR
jgi:hypothetical protein